MIKHYIKTSIYSIVIITTGIALPVIYHTRKEDKKKL